SAWIAVVVDVLAAPTSTKQLTRVELCAGRAGIGSLAPHSRNPTPIPFSPPASSRNWKRLVAAPGPAPAAPTPRDPLAVPPLSPFLQWQLMQASHARAADEQVRCGVK
ncbi:hypothetical protein PVAP13_9NG012251, partial [Panicum virgatum]